MLHDIVPNWKLEDMFRTEEEWERSFDALKTYGDRIASFDGRLTTKADVLELFRIMDEMNVRAELLAVYASARRDEDTRNGEANARYNKIVSLLSVLSEKSAFVDPQLSSLPEETLKAWAKDPDFRDYDYALGRLIAQKPYILSEKEERLLALSHDFSDDFENVFTMIDNADLEFPTVEVDGNPVRVTHGTYARLMQDPRQEVRAKVFDAYYKAYEKLKNTLAANYYANVKKNLFYAKSRGYDSYLQKCMIGEDVPEQVYRTLIDAVHGGLPALHDYVAFRREALGVDKLYMYDFYVPIVREAELSVDYDRACELVLAALAPLGEEYAGHVREAMQNRWIDVYEKEGKRSGGYCTHAYLAPHPYILLNYSRTTHDVFTLAHELGHAMHSYYSASAQPISKADYRIFVAEVASTVNEMLLLDYLLRETIDPAMQKFLLAYRLDTIRTTIFRQTMFSEFELACHEAAANGSPLTVDGLADRYEALNRTYYGDAVEADPHIRYEWSRIPHFYYSFYVYKYATGLTAALDISQRILAGEQGVLDRYRAFLNAGGSKSPYEILKDAGVDLATSAPYNRAMELFRDTLDRLRGQEKGR